jgi:AcrR family transcriptional regulator
MIYGSPMLDGASAPEAMPKRPARTRRSQAERSALSEDRLLDAALQLISERGYDRTTLQAIGDVAGYSRGLVSHRFGSKEGLLWALLERMFAQWGADSLQPAVGRQVGIAALHAAIEATRSSMHAAPSMVFRCGARSR